MTDYSREVRRAILPALKASGAVTGLVPASSIYPSTVPIERTFPFIRYGVPITTPLRATGLDSSQSRITINAFAKSTATVTAEDLAYLIGAAVKGALDGSTLAIEGGMKVRLFWLITTPRADPDEKDAWATSVTFRAEVSG